MPPSSLRPLRTALQCLNKGQARSYSSSPKTSPFAPRHFLSIADLTPAELTTLVRNASSHKTAIKSGSIPKNLLGSLSGKTVAMMFNKLSTRTRVSTEAAVATMGGHPMFLGKNDIQLGVNESLKDTSIIISSMTSCMVARVGPHSDVADLAKYSSVPVINALSNDYHPLQTIADFLTIHEAFPSTPSGSLSSVPSLGLEGLKIAWIGDSNNVLFDLAIGALKLGVNISVASPNGYTIPPAMLEIIKSSAEGVSSPGKLTQTSVPEEAIKNADILVTDTWVSMGQEEESAKRLKAFAGYQITSELAKKGGAKEGWKFMHCLPRHQEEVADEVFYGPRSLVFQEGENRLWAAICEFFRKHESDCLLIHYSCPGRFCRQQREHRLRYRMKTYPFTTNEIKELAQVPRCLPRFSKLFNVSQSAKH
jgi:ornithine carbamoyltransferase